MRLKMMGGGGSIDYDELTATAENVPESLTFIGNGSDDEQTGTLPDRENMHGAPGMESNPAVPIHTAVSSMVSNDTQGDSRIVLAPPRGKYPGTDKSFVGCYPIDLGITPDKIANGSSVCGIIGAYGSDGTISPNDVREGKVGYGSNGRIVGAATDYGQIIKTIAAGESLSINKGFYGNGKISAKDLASQTPGNLDASRMVSGQNGYSNGNRVWGGMVDRGSYAWAGRGGHGASGIGEGSENGVDYYAFNNAPDGWYHNQGGTWDPELRLERSTVRNYLGVEANKIILGQTIAGIAGNAKVFKYSSWSGSVTPSSNSKAIYDPNVSKNFYYRTFHYYPSGFREIHLVAWTGNGDVGFLYPGGAGHYFVSNSSYKYTHMANGGSLTFTNTDIEIPCSTNGTYWVFIAGVSS